MDLLRYEDDAMRVTPPDRAELGLVAAHRYLETLRTDNQQGWMDAPFDTTSARFFLKKAAALKKNGFRHLLVIGIGGSDLGARLLVDALGRVDRAMTVSFLSAPDPDAFTRLLPTSDAWKKTAVYVVSKSGTTLETLSVFLTARAALIRAVGSKKHAAHVVITTDLKEENPLLAFAREQGYDVLPHPQNVGGRFSVLTVVGLFPAACAGVNVAQVLSGAQRLEEDRRLNKETALSARFAANHVVAYKAGRKIQVLMPYASRLSQLGPWFRQLWAESLGKNGQGPTPVAAMGPVDQHSQIQLYNDGPDDKTVTFVEVEKFASSVNVPKVLKPDALANLSGLDFGDILHAERAGTAHALTKSGRANGTLTLPELSPESVGAMLQFFLQATAYAGGLLGVDTFDQPGVEEGKHAARKILGV